MDNNTITLSGTIVGEFLYDHECYGEKFYTVLLSTNRTSGMPDILTIMCGEYLIKRIKTGMRVVVIGSVRTYNAKDDTGNHIRVFVFADSICEAVDEDVDEVCIIGYLCKISAARETPLHRFICDTVVAVNRTYGKTDYIPVIFWGRSAEYISSLSVGTKIKLDGRLQSRLYEKCGSNAVAYEVSARDFELLED